MKEDAVPVSDQAFMRVEQKDSEAQSWFILLLQRIVGQRRASDNKRSFACCVLC